MPSDGEKKFAVFSTIAVAAVAPFVFVGAVSAFGFGAAGIVGGSPAAAFMASYGGAVSSGSLCATLQSIGAAGLGPAGVFLTTGVGAAIGAGLSALGLQVNSPITVILVNKDGETLELEIRPHDSITKVNSKIHDLTGVWVSQQILRFSEITLEDDKK
ncbi:hypothetical protein BGX26_003399, partial [Mortierella sp. AD094]